MSIIGINKNKRNFIFLFFILLCLGPGCRSNDYLPAAAKYALESDDLYRKAIQEYKQAIINKQNIEQARFELGQLYYNHGEYKLAAQELSQIDNPQAKKFLAFSYYHLGQFSDALAIFNKTEFSDDEYLYYQGLACEKLNLFDQALKAYAKIKNKGYLAMASGRIRLIEGSFGLTRIKQISPDIERIIASAPPQEKYPQAGALILYCDEKIETTSVNTQVSSLHYAVKILNEIGKEKFSETSLDYDSTYEKVELEYARTIKPDGTVIEVGSRHIRDVSKYLNFPLYSNARVFIISFPEIAEGVTIEYKLKIQRSQLINKKDFIITYPLQASEPIISAKFSVILPEGRPLHIKLLNEQYNNFGANLEPATEKTDGRVIYKWQFKDIPQIIPEADMPAEAELNPAILISTFGSWQEVYQWWWDLAKDKIKADSQIKNKVRELTRGLKDPEAKARAIYNFCAQDIRYVAVEYGQAGYEPHKAADIFRNKYGDCKDQAVLLVTMLREAGFFGWPVLISTKDAYNLNPDFASANFNHCIAALSLNNRIIFLDPTAQTCSFDDLPAADQARKVLLFKEDSCQILDTPLYAAGHNLIKQELKLKINPDETIAAEKTVSSRGIYDQAQRYWLLYTPPELIEQKLKEIIQDVSIGAKLGKYNIKNLNNLNQPVVLNYAFGGREYFTNAGNLRIMPQLAGLDTSVVSNDERKYAIDFEILDSKEIVIKVEIPDNFAVKYMPNDISEDSRWLKFSVKYGQKGNAIYFRQKTELKEKSIAISDYLTFKAFLEGLAKRIKERVILEKINP